MCFNKDPSKYAAIWKFLMFATTPESMADFAKTGYLAVTNAKVPMEPGQEAAYAQIKYAVVWDAWPGGSAGLEIDRRYINPRMEIIQGRRQNADLSTVLDQLASECNKLIK
jgi:ABC-type glycerol-3-phosphate transport system substrate-binding protein